MRGVYSDGGMRRVCALTLALFSYLAVIASGVASSSDSEVPRWYQYQDLDKFSAERDLNKPGEENESVDADAGGPYVGYEGSAVIFDASNSSGPPGRALEYRWDFENDGVWDTNWSSDPTATHTYFDDFIGEVAVEVRTASIDVEDVVHDYPIHFHGQVSGVESRAQSFVPQQSSISKVTLNVAVDGEPARDLYVSIRISLNGTDLTSTSLPPEDIPDVIWCEFVDFDLPDISVVPGDTYFIVLTTLIGGIGYYRICGTYVDYPNGTHWVYHPTSGWIDEGRGYSDLRFKTYSATGEVSDIDTANVTIYNVPPTVEWTSESSDGTIVAPPYPEGKEILFEATVYDPGIYDTFTYDWDFGDGTILLDAGHSVIHAYGDNDTYIVVLTVTDDDGGVGIDDTPPLLTTNENPIPSISLPFCIFLEGTTPCQAIGEFSDPGWLDTHSAVWNYGDGTYENAVLIEENDPPDATGMNITSHLYGDNGDYDITFTVLDDDGGVGTASAIAHVENLPPSVSIDVPSSVNEGEDFVLAITATDPGSDDLIIHIDWGDGTSETITYYNNGIGPDPPNSGEGVYPFTIYANLTYTYGDNGNFTIDITVEDDDGGSVQDYTIIEVVNLPPEIALPMIPLYFNEAEEFSLTAKATDPGSDDINITWILELGPFRSSIYYNDGMAPDPPLSPWGTFPFVVEDTINHTYGDNGYYNVTITAADDDGGVTTAVLTIEIRNLEPSVDIGGPYAGDENSPIVFTATATDQGSDDLTFIWNWGDSTTDAVVFYNDGIGPDPPKSPWGTYPFNVTHSISHIWGDNGNFTVTLIVVDDDGGTTINQTIVVIDNIDPTISNLTYEVFYNVPRTQGYWNFQCTEKLPSPDHVGIQQEFVDYISSHSRVFSGISTKDEVCEYLGVLDNSNMTQKAMQQLIALWLNVASDKLNLSSEMFIPQLNTTMNLWELVVWIEDTILNDDEDNMEIAKDLADEINNGNLIPYAVLTFWGTASDPGSDDLIFTWDWGDGKSTEHIYYNNGVSPDPYPSPDVNPITVTDTAMHSYALAGTYTITLTVMDDDGGSATLVLTLII